MKGDKYNFVYIIITNYNLYKDWSPIPDSVFWLPIPDIFYGCFFISDLIPPTLALIEQEYSRTNSEIKKGVIFEV